MVEGAKVMICVDCGGHTCTSYGKYNGEALCSECYKKRYQNELDERSQDLIEPSDFSAWKDRDMSELFLMHLGNYVKEPNEHSFSLISMAYRWACHDNHGLANSFSNALKWAKINLRAEEKRWRSQK